jgi:hypothetical protein
MKPIFLYRKDDGERFTKQSNGKYTMDSSQMNPKYEFTYKRLIDRCCVDSLDKCVIIEYKSQNDGHGNEDYD